MRIVNDFCFVFLGYVCVSRLHVKVLFSFLFGFLFVRNVKNFVSDLNRKLHLLDQHVDKNCYYNIGNDFSVDVFFWSATTTIKKTSTKEIYLGCPCIKYIRIFYEIVFFVCVCVLLITCVINPSVFFCVCVCVLLITLSASRRQRHLTVVLVM
jgi:hypothetical protein